MNYIELINRFWSIDLEANFTHLEVHLYFKLLEINNRLGWKESFRFPNSRLEAEIGSKSKSFINARQRLIDFGVISYKKGNTRNAGIYKLLGDDYFPKGTLKESNKESNQESKTNYFPKGTLKESNKESNNDTNQGINREVIRGSLTKLNKTKIEDRSLKKEKKEKFDLDYVDIAFRSLVSEFIRYRRQDIKKPFKTERGVKQFYEELKKLSGNNLSKAATLVEYAKAREWMTVYPIKEGKSRKLFRNESVEHYDNEL